MHSMKLLENVNLFESGDSVEFLTQKGSFLIIAQQNPTFGLGVVEYNTVDLEDGLITEPWRSRDEMYFYLFSEKCIIWRKEK